jgi:hypothetical protein
LDSARHPCARDAQQQRRSAYWQPVNWIWSTEMSKTAFFSFTWNCTP